MVTTILQGLEPGKRKKWGGGPRRSPIDDIKNAGKGTLQG